MQWVSERGCVKWVVKRVFVALRCAEEEAERKAGGRESGEVDGGDTNDGVEEEEEEGKRRRKGKQRARRVRVH